MDRLITVKCALVWVLVVLCCATASQVEAGAPQLQPLGKLRSSDSPTTGIAVDNAGNLFLSKARLNTLSKFDIYGRNLQRFTPVKIGEGGLAVAPMGDVVYVAAGKSVLIFNADTGAEIGPLGTAEKEFGWVANVALDGRGYIYVADSGERSVRVYDQQGTFQFEFAGPGETPGQLGLLSAMAINRSMGAVWVADNLAKGENPGPKILVYDLDGQFLRELSGATDFGDKPVGSFGAITFDSLGRVYILDDQNNEIRCFDPQTTSFAIYNQEDAFANKLVGRSDMVFELITNRLFVASGQQVFILGVDGATRPVPVARR